MSEITVGSICSGIEAASVAWRNIGFEFKWFSEISEFPSKVLKNKYPEIPNLGDMCNIPKLIANQKVYAPDLICGGTPCQAFSLAGWKKGLNDDRGNLTLKFVDIINANDEIRINNQKKRTLVFWENVEGVLRDKTNAFGCFLASLAGYEEEINYTDKWPQSGLIRGPIRNVAWRVIDAKYFGLPQQRKRLYVIAGGKDFHPEEIIFELGEEIQTKRQNSESLTFEKDGHNIEVFRSYTDCLYSAYGTKWNGNAAAYNGSLFVAQNGRLRRFTPLECERLMGFPDNYTQIPGARPTTRYQAVGNSWAVPVVQWLGEKINFHLKNQTNEVTQQINELLDSNREEITSVFGIGKDLLRLRNGKILNGTAEPFNQIIGDIKDIIDVNADEKIYITPVGCKGILRRKEERCLKINSRLEEILNKISSEWSEEEIESISRKQSRGKFSTNVAQKNFYSKQPSTMSLWDD